MIHLFVLLDDRDLWDVSTRGTNSHFMNEVFPIKDLKNDLVIDIGTKR